MKRLKLYILLLLTFYFPLFANAQYGWRELGEHGSRHLGSSVLVRTPKGKVYAAFGHGIFEWNGSKWTELGYGPTALNVGNVQCIAADDAGNIYAAGSYNGQIGRAHV